VQTNPIVNSGQLDPQLNLLVSGQARLGQRLLHDLNGFVELSSQAQLRRVTSHALGRDRITIDGRRLRKTDCKADQAQ
jgi:hypothetical protein